MTSGAGKVGLIGVDCCRYSAYAHTVKLNVLTAVLWPCSSSMERSASPVWNPCAPGTEHHTHTVHKNLGSLPGWFEQQQHSWVKSSQVPSKLVCVATKWQGMLLSPA